MRTWRGHQLLSPATAGKYETHRKYPLFFRPDSKVTTDELIALFRDRMEGVVSDEELALGKTRIIGTETASQVHLMRVHPDLPSFMAVEEWLCFSNAAYAPFLPISNALTTAAAPYTYVLPNYALDTNSAAHAYKKLNALAAQDRKRLGLNVERYWENRETKWQADWQKTLGEAKKLAESGDKAGAAALLTACSLGAQTSALEDAGRIYDELLWHLMETTNTMTYGFSYDTLQVGEKKESVFMPLVDAAAYAAQRNWRQEQTSKGLRLSREGQSVEILPSDGKRTSKGVLKQGGKERAIAAVTKEGKVYIPLDKAEKIF